MSETNPDKLTAAEDISEHTVDVSQLYDTPRSTRPNSDVSIVSSELGHQLR